MSQHFKNWKNKGIYILVMVQKKNFVTAVVWRRTLMKLHWVGKRRWDQEHWKKTSIPRSVNSSTALFFEPSLGRQVRLECLFWNTWPHYTDGRLLDMLVSVCSWWLSWSEPLIGSSACLETALSSFYSFIILWREGHSVSGEFQGLPKDCVLLTSRA